MPPSAGSRVTGEPIGGPDDFAATFGLGLTLRGAHLRAADAYQAALAPLGMELRHFAVLIELTGHGPLTQSELAARTGNDKVAMMRNIDHMEAGGLVVRSARPGDRRVRVVSLTPRGEEVFARAHLAARDVAAQLLAHLAPADRARFTELLAQFVRCPGD